MSNNPLTWKIVLILIVVGLTAFFGYPPGDKINLGLDLKGGAHILMKVKTETAVRSEMDLRVDYVGQTLNDANLAYSSVLPTGATTLELRGTDPARRAEVREALKKVVGQWDVQSLGGGNWRITMPSSMRAFIETNAVKQTLNILRNRIDEFGVADPNITEQGMTGDRILIQLPGVQDPERVKDLIGKVAKLEWKALTYPPGVARGFVAPDTETDLAAMFGGALPEDTEAAPQPFLRPDGSSGELWWPLKRVSVVSGNDLRNAYRTSDEWNDPAVAFELTPDAGQRFEAATRENVGRQMAIVLDGKVISAPEIIDVIRDQGQIKGGFDVEAAEDLALQLRSGAIPAEVVFIEERTVGPSLGHDSIRSGLTAGIAGFIGVMLFMLIYYRLAGVNAVVALALNILLVFGTLGALPVLFAGIQATLTLPGIAGLILTVGMAVDSNVLIFERIREELRLGKTVRSAVEQGFGKAFMTILDCNVTTLVAAFFLFSYGTGPVKGFAVTLTIGLLASMFTAVFVSRQLFELVIRARGRAESLSI